jgi:hypothetical protein
MTNPEEVLKDLDAWPPSIITTSRITPDMLYPNGKEPMTKTKREQILEEAARLIVSDRNDQYGPPDQNFQNIADMWNIRFQRKLSEPLTASDVAHAMALLKIVRDIAGYKEDSAVDGAAYLALYAELAEKDGTK